MAKRGEGRGYLRLTVERKPGDGPQATVAVSSEVPTSTRGSPDRAGSARIGRVLYSFTQKRIHVIVTQAFLRSLARLDLEPSVVGALATATDARRS